MDSRSFSTVNGDDDAEDDDDNEDAVPVVFPCRKSCSSDNTRWQHVNLEHISRRIFPTAASLKEHGRNLCCKCGFAYSSHWKSCRRSQGSGNCRCGSDMVDPDASTWLFTNVGSSNIRVVNHVITMSERNEPLESRKGISLPETSDPSASSTGQNVVVDDLALEGIRAATTLSYHSSDLDESAVFFSAMNEISTLPVHSVLHIPKSIRPLFSQVLAREIKHAFQDGI